MMKTSYCILFSFLFVLFGSCHKPDDNNDVIAPPPPPQTWEWFKLMRVERITKLPNSYQEYHRDSIEIALDSVRNKIVFRKYSFHFNGINYDKDTSVETFTYNSGHQLVLYEHNDSDDQLFISRMEFVRNPEGEVTKVLSQYNNGLMAGSEGIVTYRKFLNTIFITYVDSSRKHRLGYSDAQDYYQVGVVRNKVVYRTDYSMATSGKMDSAQLKIVYDTNGNKVKSTSQYNNNSPVSSTFKWSGLPNFSQKKQLQRFLTQWAGDLHWFTRAKLFDFSELIYVSPATGEAAERIEENNITKLEFLGSQHPPTYDGFSWSKAIETSGGMPAYHAYYIENYTYRP